MAWGQIDVVKKEWDTTPLPAFQCFLRADRGLENERAAAAAQLSRIGEEDINIIQGRGWKAPPYKICVSLYNIKQLSQRIFQGVFGSRLGKGFRKIGLSKVFKPNFESLKSNQRVCGGLESPFYFFLKVKAVLHIKVSQDVCKTLMPLNFWQSGS